MGYDLGVDLGGTSVAAAIGTESRVEMVTLGDHAVTLPAVVCVGDDDALLAGDAAARRAVGHPDRAGRELKHRLGSTRPVQLGGRPYPAAELLGALLQDVVARVAENLGSKPDRVLLTHPAHWSPTRLEAFGEVIRAAGLADVRTGTEPEAVAAHYAAAGRIAEGDTVAVYDLGGGTFDATVLRRTADGVAVLGRPDGIERLGGGTFDEAILSHVNQVTDGPLAGLDRRDPHHLAAVGRLRRECVLAKETLSAETATSIPVLLPNRQTEVALTRAEFEQMIHTSIETTIGTLLKALESAGVEPNELASVLLVGDSARIPLVAKMITDVLARPTVLDAHPKHPVALGAAILAGRTARPAATEPPERPAPAQRPDAHERSAEPEPADEPARPGPEGRRPAAAGARAAAAASTTTVPPLAEPAPARPSDPAPNSLFEPATPIGGTVLPATPPAAPVGPARPPSSRPHSSRPHSSRPQSSRPHSSASQSNRPGADALAALGIAVAPPDGAQGPSAPDFPDSNTSFLDGNRDHPDHNQGFLDSTTAALPTSVIDRPRPGSGQLGGRPPSAPQGPADPSGGGRPRRRALILVAAVAAAVLLVGTGYLIWSLLPGAPAAGTTTQVAAPDGAPAPAASVPSPTVGGTVPVGGTPGFVVVSPDGRQALVANQTAGVITVVDTATNEVTTRIPVPAGPPQYLAYAPDGRRVYVSIWDQARTVAAVGVLDTASNAIVATIPVRTRPYLSAVTPDGQRLFVPNHDSGTVSVIDTGTDKVINEIKVAPNPHWIEMSADGTRAYAANHESNLVSVIDTTDYAILAEVPVQTSPHSVAVRPNRPEVANVNYDAKSVSMIDTNDDRVLATIPVGTNPQDVTWAPDGRHAYVANSTDGTVSVIDGDTATVTATVRTGNGPTSVAVLPDGSAAYVSNLKDGTLSVLQIAG